MPAFSPFQPLPGLSWYVLPLWPLIFWRIQRLKAWFRQNGGPGAQMLWGVMKDGRVVVIRLSDHFREPEHSLRAAVSNRLAEALSDTDGIRHPDSADKPHILARTVFASLVDAPMAPVRLPDT